jgi:hypothetical protein
MSHFPVLIVGDDIEGQLAPYDEGMAVEPYKERVDSEDFDRFVRFYGNPSPSKEYEIRGVALAKEVGFYPITEATARGAWAALAEDWNGAGGGWDEEGPFTWSTYNPASKWDWFVVGGRWRGHWTLRDGRKVDQALRGDIDFEGIEAAEAARAGADWALWEPILTGLPAATPWAEFVAGVEAKEMVIEVARERYNAQPQVVALKRAFPNHWSLKPDDFGADRDEYIAGRAQQSWVPFALVLDGKWHEKGRMGWFGMSTDEPKDQAPWAVEIRSIVMNLPEESLLTIVDCHI